MENAAHASCITPVATGSEEGGTAGMLIWKIGVEDDLKASIQSIRGRCHSFGTTHEIKLCDGGRRLRISCGEIGMCVCTSGSFPKEH